MYKTLLSALMSLFLFSTPVTAGKKEIYYSSKWCMSKGGSEKPVKLSDGTFADCLLPLYAIEADFGHKWYESIGQSLHYARLTGKQAAILLIIEKESEVKFVERALLVVDEFHLPITVCVVYVYPGAEHSGLCTETWDENGEVINGQK